MYLKECKINNFRSIKTLDISFENSFQILVGMNESGKSNILRALSFLNSDINPLDDDVRDAIHDEEPIRNSDIKFVYGIEKSETGEIYKNISSRFFSSDLNNPIIKIGSKTLSLSDFCSYKKEGIYKIDIANKSKCSTYWEMDASKCRILPNWRKVPENWAGYSQFDENDFDFINISDYAEISDDDTLEELTVEDLNSVVGEEIVSIVNDNLNECIIWKYNESNLLPGRIEIEKFKADPDICEPLKTFSI